MIKIGIECESIEGGNQWGVGRLTMKLLDEISRRPELGKNFRFVLYFKNKIPDYEFLKAPIFEKKIVPVPIFRHRLFPIYYFLLLPIKLWFEKLDWMFWPNYMLPIIAFNRSLVMLTEDVYYETHAGKLPFRYRLAYGIFGWWTAKFASKILAISETSKKNISKLYSIDPSRIFVDRPGVDLKNNSESENPNSLFKTQNSPYILYVGQMFPRRHARETILAFEKIAGDYPGMKLIAIGIDKYEKPTINSLVLETNKKLGRDAILHKDFIKDSELLELYAGAKALVYVSDREAYGLPPLEALGFGVPPIIADNELGHELFGEYAFFAKSGSIDDIAESIQEAVNNEQKSMNIRNNGPEFVKKYNWKNFTDKFLENVR
jgi:glycosyltransferase involved in cell wall biosynthesis